MSGFKALNAESDDESDNEFDDTKEIQIEEALKLYQAALQVQSHGPKKLNETRGAYEALFKSEIFAYPESQSDFNRLESLDLGQSNIQSLSIPEPQQIASNDADNAPSNLSQILHLSFKNRGQYHLDAVEDSVKHPTEDHADDWTREQIGSAMKDFTDALDKDDDDVDLWRRAGRVGGALGSKRMERYCLESALDGDEDETDDVLGMPNIETSHIKTELQDVEAKVEDQLSLHPSKVYQNPPTHLDVLGDKFKLYPFLPPSPPRTPPKDAGRIELRPYEPTWTAVGQMIVQRLMSEQNGTVTAEPGCAVKIILPIESEDEPVSLPRSYGGDSPNQRPTEEVAEASTELVKDTVAEEGPVQEGDAEMQDLETLPQDDHGGTATPKPENTIELPARKRSADDAELPENSEGVRVRSKRIRARGSMPEGNIGDGSKDVASNVDEKFQPFIDADRWLFEILNNIMEKFGVEAFSPGINLRYAILKSSDEIDYDSSVPLLQALRDFFVSLSTWSEEKSQVLVNANKQDEATTDTRHSGLIAFLDHSKPPAQDVEVGPPQDGLKRLVEAVNEEWLTTEDVALRWIDCLLNSKTCFEVGTSRSESSSSYEEYLWPEPLKQMLVRMILAVDDLLFEHLQSDPSERTSQVSKNRTATNSTSTGIRAADTMIETLFELHLDIHSRITNPASEVDQDTRSLQESRLEKWSNLARDAVNSRTEQGYPHLYDEKQLDLLGLRHLWASCFHLEFLPSVPREHLLRCIEELKQTFAKYHEDINVSLPNNALMPELSVKAAEREISKLETMDFFLGIFNKDDQHAVDLIERLEPILIPASVSAEEDLVGGHVEGVSPRDDGIPSKTPVQSRPQILSTFVRKANASLRFSLWCRLRDAYEEIGYDEKILSINLQCLGLIMNELKSTYIENNSEDRSIEILRWINESFEIIKATLKLVQKQPDTLECLDYEHMKSSIAAVADLFILLYPVALFDDQCQLSQKGPLRMNPFRHYPLESLHTASITLHDMQVRTSILLYKLIQEGMLQYPERFTSPAEDRLEYLRHIHYALGVRRLCKASDSLFLKFMKHELSEISKCQLDTSDDLAQIILDMYDLHCFSSPLVKQDHGCEPDYLDRETAVDLVDFVMEKARKVNMKDLLKSDLGKTVDKLNTNLGIVKSSTATTRNKKLYNAYMRSPLDRLELYRALQGIGDLSSVRVSAGDAIVASKGWYALKGSIELARCRGQKTKGSTQTDDLQAAIALLVQDLEYSDEKWETWYRLAQANDALIDEHVLWSAEKINIAHTELAQGERTSIHAYVMAVANAVRNSDSSTDTSSKIAELYAEFGLRVYSETREPFSMQAFSLTDFPNRYFNALGRRAGEFKLYQERSFREMKSSKALEYAGTLFKRAIVRNPSDWYNYYMLGKTLWKLHPIAGYEKGREQEFAFIDEAFKAFMQAVERLPERKDPNRQDAVLEPIYKIASTADKLVRQKLYTSETAASHVKQMLQKQKQFDSSRLPEVTEFDTWDGYILEVFRIIRNVDKVRWHHRLPFKAAQIIYLKNGSNSEAAKLAKSYLLEQHMYSPKTLSLQVWKPEHERAGRHWVYMSRYVIFLAMILDQSEDIEALQMLVRRVRKKAAEYFEHQRVWEEICTAHLRLHRRYGGIPEHQDDVIFKNMTQEEFAPRAELIDAWCKDSDNTDSLRVVLSEVCELKKLNAGLVKTTAVDDLIADTYATIFSRIGPTLAQPAETLPEPQPAPLQTTLSEAHTGPLLEERKDNIMSLSNLMNIDGTSDARPTPPPGATNEQNTRPRIKMVSRRETLKRASEACSARVPELGTAVRGKPGPKPIERIVKTEVDNREVISAEDGAGTAPSSAPGSVHDSADDESELSEPDAEMEDLLEQDRPVFPDLKVGSEEGHEEEAQDESVPDADGAAEEQIQREAVAVA